ncbi:MAG: hypothetical protein M0R80_09725 [Proteobacteria bacterium]|jgi:histone H3/H4|nr:hypothetical protein [Pseudomonadota bacterium]
MVDNIFPAYTARRIGKNACGKLIGMETATHLAKLATSYVEHLVQDAEKIVDKKNGKRITADDIDFVLSNFKDYGN